jgi:hypothetical protein
MYFLLEDLQLATEYFKMRLKDRFNSDEGDKRHE